MHEDSLAPGSPGRYNDRYRDLGVDDHEHPIQERQRIYRLHKKVFPPPGDTP